jgi:glycine hydroxymethyltransferase
MVDFIFKGCLKDLDPSVDELIALEAERQARRIILIPSESMAPMAIHESLGSVFQNIYAEGYPDENTRGMVEKEILDYPVRLANYRRYSDPRYYKGVEFADIIESLARRRCAELFATKEIDADHLFVNVQPLSGAPANNAVYTALLTPGDTIMGMNLLHGGHLSHGSSVNRSGKIFKVIHYNVSQSTEQIDYDEVQKLASENNPKVIIAGYSSYPWIPDWRKFRQIADSVGAVLLADISHIAGMIAAKIIPSPVGIAQVITFTTHKTLCGPRGAIVLTSDPALAKKLDRAVFPGEQGGPHVHVFAALATTFKLARTEQFLQLQTQIIKNCAAFTDQLKKRGLRIPFGGTNTHLVNVDCKTVIGVDGTPLSGDMAARILDVAGIVLNRNTIPGDKSALQASGIRMGTPWVTQRGLKEREMVTLANVIADILLACKPYTVSTKQGSSFRAKVDFETLENGKLTVRKLAENAGMDIPIGKHGYPFFFFMDDEPGSKSEEVTLELSGEHIRSFINYAFQSDNESLAPGKKQRSSLFTGKQSIVGDLCCVAVDRFQFTFPTRHYGLVATWLRDLSDSYIAFDAEIERRMPGPIIIREATPAKTDLIPGEPGRHRKAYVMGEAAIQGTPLPEFQWKENEPKHLRHTALYNTHIKLGAKMVAFAGWEMPVWYSSVVDEHTATRKAAGLFDVAHMGIFQAEGRDASVFLDSVCGNDIGALAVGESCYTQFLDIHAGVIDDFLVYRRTDEKYLTVVNASNDSKDWAWLNAVKDGKVQIDSNAPSSLVFGRNCLLRNLRDPKEGRDMRIDIALQGPRSRDILLSLKCDGKNRRKVMGLKRTELCEASLGGIEMVVSRTGYTGEKMAFELFVHPDQANDLWDKLLKAGTPFGLKPCGLGARDSLRTEAGLPLYGHEMAGPLGLGVGDAGFSTYVKTYKPWFIGRSAFIEQEKKRVAVVVRFHFNGKGVRMAHLGDPVLDMKGKAIGTVTSCAIDSEGYLTGQALIEKGSAMESTPIAVFQSASNQAMKPPADLQIGDRVTLPALGTIISRFPKLT